jgi:hypothetical protein
VNFVTKGLLNQEVGSYGKERTLPRIHADERRASEYTPLAHSRSASAGKNSSGEAMKHKIPHLYSATEERVASFHEVWDDESNREGSWTRVEPLHQGSD